VAEYASSKSLVKYWFCVKHLGGQLLFWSSYIQSQGGAECYVSLILLLSDRWPLSANLFFIISIKLVVALIQRGLVVMLGDYVWPVSTLYWTTFIE
jgi:hypothetical protein